MNSLKVDVTQDDIDKATPGSCGYCPIALAFKRANKKTNWCSVTLSSIEWTTHGAYFTWSLPEKLKDFIRRFDSRAEVKPFKFTIHVENVHKVRYYV